MRFLIRVNNSATKTVTLNDLCKNIKNIKPEVQELRNFVSKHEYQIYDLQKSHNVLTKFS